MSPCAESCLTTKHCLGVPLGTCLGLYDSSKAVLLDTLLHLCLGQTVLAPECGSGLRSYLSFVLQRVKHQSGAATSSGRTCPSLQLKMFCPGVHACACLGTFYPVTTIASACSLACLCVVKRGSQAKPFTTLHRGGCVVGTITACARPCIESTCLPDPDRALCMQLRRSLCDDVQDRRWHARLV